MKYIFTLLLLSSISMLSQVGGEGVYSFLNVPTSARQAALGGKALTIVDDVNQATWNPATISNKIDNQLGVNYLNFLAGISYGSASYAKEINPQVGTFHLGIVYAGYGDIIAADEDGNETGTFKASDMSISLGYAYKISDSNFKIGANAKVINSAIDNYSSFGMAADLSVIYENDSLPYAFTFVARNMGGQITTFDDTKESLPFELLLGASYQLKNVPMKWYFTLDNLQKWNVSQPNPSNRETTIDGVESEEEISFIDNAFRHFVFGVELFPQKGFNIRLGYNYRRAVELRLQDARTFAGLTAGFGLKMGRFKLNYAYTKYHPAENSSTFSLLINLN